MEKKNRPAWGRLLSALVVTAALLSFGVAQISCGGADFDPQSIIDSVRILASRTDKPYAKPGDSVMVEVLAVDGRKKRSVPMEIYWIPFLCQNPEADAYFACFAQALGDGGVSDSGPSDGGPGPNLGLLRPGTDLNPFLPKGKTYSVSLPQNIIETHAPTPGATAPYGLAILFNIACAGHVQLTEIDPVKGPQQVPIGCFGDNGEKLGPSDYVLGFTRLYAYESRTNQNPTISAVLLDSNPVDLKAGFTIDHCTSAQRKDCPKPKIETMVPESDQELDPEDIDPDGVARREQIWVTYYSTTGQLSEAARLLYDPKRGKITENFSEFQAPNEAQEGELFVVVHDNRGGAAWNVIPLHVR